MRGKDAFVAGLAGIIAACTPNSAPVQEPYPVAAASEIPTDSIAARTKRLANEYIINKTGEHGVVTMHGNRGVVSYLRDIKNVRIDGQDYFIVVDFEDREQPRKLYDIDVGVGDIHKSRRVWRDYDMDGVLDIVTFYNDPFFRDGVDFIINPSKGKVNLPEEQIQELKAEYGRIISNILQAFERNRVKLNQ